MNPPAEEEGEIQRLSSACSQEPPCQLTMVGRSSMSRITMSAPTPLVDFAPWGQGPMTQEGPPYVSGGGG